MPSRPPTFRPAAAPTREETQAAYELRRGSARERGYSPAWDAQSAIYRKAHPLCTACQLAFNELAASEVVDHVLPHKGDKLLFWDRDNWQACCRWHHDVVKQQLELMHAKRQLADADLWLHSEPAVVLARRLRGEGGQKL